MAPKGIQIPGTGECYLIWQRDFAGMIQAFRWGVFSELSGPVQYYYKSPCKREGEGDLTQKKRCCDHGSRDWNDVL